MKKHPLFLIVVVFSLSLILAACGGGPTPTPEVTPEASPSVEPSPALPQPTPTPPPTAPQVIGMVPARGEELKADQPILITFDRALDADSVEVSFEPALEGTTEVDGAQVSFQPVSLAPGQRYSMQLSATANGFETGPLSYAIQSQGYLEVANTTPADGNKGVATDAPLTVAFNRPVVPLGASGDDPSLPQPLTLDPPVDGAGEWLNTSIYVFRPTVPLLAGTEYVATVDDIADLSGSTLAEPYTFSFTTDRPIVSQVEPTGLQVAPTTTITMTFSQPMDAASTQQALSVTTKAGKVGGNYEWSDDSRVLVFKPNKSLPLGERVTVEISEAAQAYGGTANLRRAHESSFDVVPYPAVLRTQPRDGDRRAGIDDPIQIFFNAPVLEETIKFSITPEISATQVYSYYSPYDSNFTIFFPRKALTDYTVRLAAGISDPYGNKIEQPTVIRFRTGERVPTMDMVTRGAIGTYDASTETAIYFNSVNVDDINATLYRITPEQIVSVRPEDDYERWRTYAPPADQLIRRWTVNPDGTRNEVTLTREVLLDENGDPLGPGLYFLTAESPQVVYDEYGVRPRTMLVVSRYQTAIKRGTDDVLVWVTDLATGEPAAGVPVTIYSYQNDPLTGVTDEDGVFSAPLPASKEPWRSVDAFIGTESDPGWASTAWSDGISAWNYELPADYYPRPYRVHLYSDRPLYRAGDTVHLRAIVRGDDDADYATTSGMPVKLQLRNPSGNIVFSADLNTDKYGAVYADVPLSKDAELGTYAGELLIGEETFAWANLLVAAFRKPEFELNASVEPAEVIATQAAEATVAATYFFGGAVKDADVLWTLYSGPYTFTYDDGENWSFTDFRPENDYLPYEQRFREPIGSGAGKTDDLGQFTLDVPTELTADTTSAAPGSDQRVIEFSITDVNDQQVSTTTELVIHAASVYPGVRPDSYVGVAGESQLAHFIAVDALSKQPVAGQKLDVTVSQLAWRTVRERGEDGRFRYTSKVEEAEVASETLTTDAAGLAKLTWTPPDPGTYLIRATARDALGNSNSSAAFQWIAGDEYAPWRIENNDRIELVADKDRYEVGDTARVLIPSPFQGASEALITIERGGILSHEVRTLPTNSETLEIPILPEYAPNVFVSVMLVQPPVGEDPATFKLGLTELKVDPKQHILNLDVQATPDPAGPGDTVTYNIKATDADGKPVKAQMSLALVDRALLSLVPDTAPNIVDTFWSDRGLGVQTGVSLVASLNRVDEAQSRGTKGGGGGGDGALAEIDIRTDFQDIAFWQADVETDANGEATVTITLPDNLTTWEMRSVATTADTSVGDVKQNLLATKPLLIRPVLPRFVVHDDNFSAGAIVQNNTGAAQNVVLSFELDGLSTDQATSYELTIPDGDLVRVNLPVAVDDIDPTSQLARDTITIRMIATGAGYNDAVEIQLPVVRYSSPETVATAGIVPPGETRYEAITLPERYDPTQGDFTVKLEPSLAAGMIGGLDYLTHYPYECTEQTVSAFLPNAFTANALAQLGIEDPDLQANLDEQISTGLQRLYARQNTDGGWGWFSTDGEKSNPYTSAYVLFGLATVQQAGYSVDADVMRRAAAYVERQLKEPAELQGYELNQQAFFVYVLDLYARTAESDRPVAEAQLLYEESDRMAQYAQAYLALTLDAQSDIADTADQAQSLLDQLLGKAILSATGAHWEEESTDWWTMNTDTRTTAVVLDAITAIAPDQPIAPNVVRWLMSARTADRWETTHETAWALLALTDWMVASGELEAEYQWQAALNGESLGSGAVTSDTVTQPETLRVAVAELVADQINVLALDRSDGPGQLYYTAYLRNFLPVADLEPVNRGISIERRYTLLDPVTGEVKATDINSAQVGDIIEAEITLVVPNTMNYLLVEDPIPAGTEPIDTSFATTSRRYSGPGLTPGDEQNDTLPYWYWDPTTYQLKDDRVALFATTLTPGTYTFNYQLRATIPGEFNVLPARAEMMYFPETFGHGAGSSFTITKP